jgi:hypothetical protein
MLERKATFLIGHTFSGGDKGNMSCTKREQPADLEQFKTPPHEAIEALTWGCFAYLGGKVARPGYW